MKDTECPYCGAEIEINHDDGYGYEEGEIHQQTCRGCGKTFGYTTGISFHYDTHKADCMNGGEHNYKEVTQYGWPEPRVLLRCVDCDHEIRKPSNAKVSGVPPHGTDRE